MDEVNHEVSVLNDLADVIPGVVFQVKVDPDGTLHLPFVCREAKEILGFDPLEIKRAPSRLRDLVAPEEREEIADLIRRSREANTKVRREIRIRRPDESEVWLRVEATPRNHPDSPGCEWFGVAMEVTEDRERQRKLGETRALLKGLVSSLEDAVFVIGPPHRQVVESANAAVERMFGYTPQELEGGTTEMLHENHESFVEFGRLTERVLETGQTFRGEYRMRRRNGEVFPTEHVISVLDQREGWQGGVVSLVRDISERREAEAALVRSEQGYRLIIENAIEGIGVVQGNRVVFANKRLQHMLGRSPDELSRVPMEELVHPEDREVAMLRYRRRLKGEIVPDFRFRATREDGSVLWCEVNAVPIQWEFRPGLLIFFTDATEQVLAESARDRLSAAIEHAAEGILVLDDELRVVYLNRTLERMTGYSQAELLGASIRAARSGLEEIGPSVWAQVRSGEVWQGNISIPGLGNERMEAEVSLSALSAEGVDGFVVSVRDVTREVEMQSQLQMAQRMEAIGTLAGGIAHDFNNILMAISGYTDLARAELPEGSTPRAHLREVQNAAKRARALVGQILTFSRETEGVRKPVMIEPIVKEAIKFLRATLPSTVDVRQSIESTSGNVLADPTRIHQIVMNLSTNAAHAMRGQGGVLGLTVSHVDLEIAAARELQVEAGPYVRLTVSDTGAGIRADDLARIFDPYFTTKEKGEGTGLGLAVVDGIVREYGGTITCRSVLGEGSTFTVYLPWIKAETEIRKTPEPVPMGQGRVLFVDDEPTLVQLGKELLGRLGYEVEGHADPEEALERFKEDPDRYDVVITDLTMPRLTGDCLASRILDIRPQIPVIMCTGFAEAGAEAQARESGIRALLMKPLVLDQIGRTIRDVLSG